MAALSFSASRPSRAFARVASLAFACTAAATLSAPARAEEPFPAAQPPPPPPPLEEAVTGHRLFATLDALGVVDGRYALQLEASVTAHESLAVMGWYMQHEVSGKENLLDDGFATTYDTQTVAGGADLQLRHYFGREHARGVGLYVAPGFELQRFTTLTTACTIQGRDLSSPQYCDGGTKLSWWYYGPSLDVGAQLVTSFGLVFGGSLGAHYRFATENVDLMRYSWEWSATNGGGFRPRLRLNLGWAFL